MSTAVLAPSAPTTVRPCTTPRRSRTGRWAITTGRTVVTVKARAFGIPVRGHLAGASGIIEVADDITRSHVSVTIRSDMVETGRDAHDRAARGDGFLDADAHPTVTFTAHRLQPVIELLVTADGDRPLWWLVGQVTARGVTRPVRLALGVVRHDGDTLAFRATGSIRRSEFGAVGKRRLISDDIDITVEGCAHRESADVKQRSGASPTDG